MYCSVVLKEKRRLTEQICTMRFSVGLPLLLFYSSSQASLLPQLQRQGPLSREGGEVTPGHVAVTECVQGQLLDLFLVIGTISFQTRI